LLPEIECNPGLAELRLSRQRNCSGKGRNGHLLAPSIGFRARAASSNIAPTHFRRASRAQQDGEMSYGKEKSTSQEGHKIYQDIPEEEVRANGHQKKDGKENATKEGREEKGG
jgi:hypothetical protein